jgi:dTDP-4-dehydrorhamnose reductase
VFDGRKTTPYQENDPVGPLSAYGRSKLAGEQALAASGLERHLIVRTSWLHGPDGKNFVGTILRLAAEREELRVVADQVGSPTFTGDLAEALFALTGAVLHGEGEGRRDQYGIYHFANAGQCSWHEFAEAIVAEARERGAKLAARRVVPIATADYPLPAPRPAWSVLATGRYQAVTGIGVPPWREGLTRHLAELFGPVVSNTSE